MRIALANGRNCSQPDLFHQHSEAFGYRILVEALVNAQHLGNLVADGHCRVERSRRVLWDKADPVATKALKLLDWKLGDIHAFEHYRTGNAFGVRLKVTQHLVGESALA